MAYEYITDTGIIIPDTSTVLAQVQQEWRNALGQDLNLDPNTPQGQMITAEVLARMDILRTNAKLANQLNPNQATGVFLRSIGGLMGINDTETSRSVCVDCAVIGAPDTLFPVGTRAVNQDGAAFLSIDDITLNASGEGTVSFQAELPGPIVVGVNELTPAQPLLGWSSVSNPSPAIVGSAAMTDYEFRLFRQNALANQSNNSVRSVYSKLTLVPGVKSVSVRENDLDIAQLIDGVALEPHSLWVCVNDDGGLSAEIASTLLACKTPGCRWSVSTNGSGTPVVYPTTDPYSGQVYEVKFVRSVPRTVYTRLYVRQNTTMSDLATSVVNAVLAYAAGEVEGQPGFTVGADVSPFDISGAVFCMIPGTYVRRCEVSDDGVTWTTSAIDIPPWERAVLPRGNISVVLEG